MRAVLDELANGKTEERLAAQIERMNDIVRYQLRKPARLIGEGIGLPALAVRKELTRLADGLSKVYRDKSVAIHIEVEDAAEFRGDRGDFMEVAGNLLDNACKWCKREVNVSVSNSLHDDGRQGIRLTVSDDGPGIPEDAAQRLLERGMRLDESAPGHGIGLAVVREIAANYAGNVHIGRSAAGGAELSVELFATLAADS